MRRRLRNETLCSNTTYIRRWLFALLAIIHCQTFPDAVRYISEDSVGQLEKCGEKNNVDICFTAVETQYLCYIPTLDYLSKIRFSVREFRACGCKVSWSKWFISTRKGGEYRPNDGVPIKWWRFRPRTWWFVDPREECRVLIDNWQIYAYMKKLCSPLWHVVLSYTEQLRWPTWEKSRWPT